MRLPGKTTFAPIIGVFILAAFLPGCAGVLAPPPEVDAAKANTIINTNRGNPELIILDVRSPREYEEGHIEGALNIPVESASFHSETGRLDKGKTYIVYCRSGNRSTTARELMLEMGFTRVVNMTGGMLGWPRAGFKVVKEE
ncbi:MAG: rhodanese-like domain-containing protein [Candidatus Latescibacterota bacterium]